MPLPRKALWISAGLGAALSLLAWYRLAREEPPVTSSAGRVSHLSRVELPLRLLGRAEAIRPGPEKLRPLLAEIGHDRRPGLFQHPPAAHRWCGVPSHSQARLSAALGLLPKAWDSGSNGVEFRAACRGPAGEREELLTRPVTAPGGWHTVEVALEGCSQPSTCVELETRCGPGGDCRWDWAVWGSPTVSHDRSRPIAAGRLALLISIDTLRHDRLGVYGAPRPTSPNLDRLAKDSIVFETAVSSSPWTLPSHASLLTSTLPHVNGVNKQRGISSALPLLAETFRDAGWQTAGFTDVALLGPNFGFDRGFDSYEYREGSEPVLRGARWSHQRVVDWLTAADDRPAFVFWHIFDVHGPYGAPAPFGGMFRPAVSRGAEAEHLGKLISAPCHDYLQLERFSSLEDLVASYDEGIAATDHAIGQTLEILRAAGAYDDALIVVTSDHGESLFENGVWVGHGLFLTDDQIRVPLLLKLPGNRGAGRRVARPARLIDVAPTMLEVLGIPIPPSHQGESLLPAGRGPDGAAHVAYGYAEDTGSVYVRDGHMKLISPWGFDAAFVSPDGLRGFLRPRPADEASARRLAALAEEQLYDLRADPSETRNLADSVPEELIARYRSLMAGYLRRSALASAAYETGSVPTLTKRQAEELRALGYIDPW